MSPARIASLSIAITLLSLVPSRAQVAVDVRFHGAPFISALYTLLSEVPAYRLEAASRSLRALEAGSGEEIFTISHTRDDEAVISGLVYSVVPTAPHNRRSMQREIAAYNDRASIGTLYFDQAHGAIMMRHRINPGMTGTTGAARVAVGFGEAVRLQRAHFRRLAGGR